MSERIRVGLATKLLEGEDCYLFSNELRIQLPLNHDEFVYPLNRETSEDFDIYSQQEYITVKYGHKIEDRLIGKFV